MTSELVMVFIHISCSFPSISHGVDGVSHRFRPPNMDGAAITCVSTTASNKGVVAVAEDIAKPK